MIARLVSYHNKLGGTLSFLSLHDRKWVQHWCNTGATLVQLWCGPTVTASYLVATLQSSWKIKFERCSTSFLLLAFCPEVSTHYFEMVLYSTSRNPTSGRQNHLFMLRKTSDTVPGLPKKWKDYIGSVNSKGCMEYKATWIHLEGPIYYYQKDWNVLNDFDRQ